MLQHSKAQLYFPYILPVLVAPAKIWDVDIPLLEIGNISMHFPFGNKNQLYLHKY